MTKVFTQCQGVEFFEIFAYVVRYESIMILCKIAAKEDYELAEFNVHTAFLYRQLQKDIYLQQLEAYTNKDVKFHFILEILNRKDVEITYNSRLKYPSKISYIVELTYVSSGNQLADIFGNYYRNEVCGQYFLTILTQIVLIIESFLYFTILTI